MSNVTRVTARKSIASTVDALGSVKAKIADLTIIERELKDRLIDAGNAVNDGNLFRATVSHEDYETLDMNAVRAKLTPQFIAKHTRRGQKIVVRVVARRRS